MHSYSNYFKAFQIVRELGKGELNSKFKKELSAIRVNLLDLKSSEVSKNIEFMNKSIVELKNPKLSQYRSELDLISKLMYEEIPLNTSDREDLLLSVYWIISHSCFNSFTTTGGRIYEEVFSALDFAIETGVKCSDVTYRNILSAISAIPLDKKQEVIYMLNELIQIGKEGRPVLQRRVISSNPLA